MSKAKTKTLAENNPAPLPITLTRDELFKQFEDFMRKCDEELDALENPELANQAAVGQAVAEAEEALAAGNNSESVLNVRENLKQLIEDHAIEGARIRAAVRRAEATARRVEARGRTVKESILTYMLNRGVLEIPTMYGYFKVGKLSNQMHITDEDLIPSEYFDEIPTVNRVLNKDRLLAALDSGKEVAGCHLEKDRKNLLIK